MSIPWIRSEGLVLDVELDIARGSIDAGLDRFTGFAMDPPGPQVTNLSRLQRHDARVADADSAPARHEYPGGFADGQ